MRKFPYIIILIGFCFAKESLVSSNTNKNDLSQRLKKDFVQVGHIDKFVLDQGYPFKKQSVFWGFFIGFFRNAFFGFSRDRFFFGFFYCMARIGFFSFRFVKKNYVKLVFRTRKKLKKIVFFDFLLTKQGTIERID